jgi:subfamily B ATP-binding cassette protein MsbA
MNTNQIIKDYTKITLRNFLNKIIIAVLFSVLVAGSTSAVAYLLDPAIKKIFIEKMIILFI